MPHPVLLRTPRLTLLVIGLSGLASGIGAAVAPVRDVPGYRLRIEEPQPGDDRRATPGLASAATGTLASLSSAWAGAPDRLEEMILANALGGEREQNGFVRYRVGREFELRSDSIPREGDGWRIVRTEEAVVWATRVRIAEAWGLRVRLENVTLPDAAQVWVIGGLGGPAADARVLGPFGRELMDPERGLWLPVAPGPEIAIEVHLPRNSGRVAARWTVADVAEVFDLTSPWLREETSLAARRAGERGSTWESCRIDASCISSAEVPAIDDVREAVAKIFFTENGTLFGCTATLLADLAQTGTPYLLTANHCFETASAAASITAYFDFWTSTCNGPTPNVLDMPQTSGSTLLSTTPDSDFTLVELDGLPPGEVYFVGWTAQRPEAWEVLHGVTHPGGHAQSYHSTLYRPEDEPGLCGNAYDRSRYHLGPSLDGTAYYGSSGGAMFAGAAAPKVVGPIRGACFTDPDWSGWCEPETYDNVVGSLEHTHDLVAPWLGDESPPEIFHDGFESGDVTDWN